MLEHMLEVSTILAKTGSYSFLHIAEHRMKSFLLYFDRTYMEIMFDYKTHFFHRSIHYA